MNPPIVPAFVHSVESHDGNLMFLCLVGDNSPRTWKLEKWSIAEVRHGELEEVGTMTCLMSLGPVQLSEEGATAGIILRQVQLKAIV